MSIKSKRSGPAPIYSERWQVLATNPALRAETILEFRLSRPGTSPTVAMREIRTFQQRYQTQVKRT